MTAFNVILGIIGGLASCVAIWQYAESRRKTRGERERLGRQLGRSQATLRAAIAGAQLADAIVQRAKDPSTTVAELQTLARLTRGALLSLAVDLDDQAKVLEAWRVGKELAHSYEASSTGGELEQPAEASGADGT
jgi:hypothetical protein